MMQVIKTRHWSVKSEIMMSKGLRWLIFALVVLLVFDWIVISYWQDIHLDVSASLLIKMLIVAPLALVLGFYALTYLFSYITKKENHPVESPAVEDDRDLPVAEPFSLEVKQPLSILATAMVTPLGNDVTQIIASLRSNKLAEPDPVLKFQKTYPYLSRRIQAMPALNNQEKVFFKQEDLSESLASRPLFTDRSKRVEQIMAHLFKELSLVLQSIDIKKLNPDPEENTKSVHQARLHPEWISQTKKSISEETPAIYRPDPSLKVLFILPTHILEVEREILSDILKQHLNLLDMGEQRELSYHIVDVENSDDTQRLIYDALLKHSNHDHDKHPQLLLMMGLDSWIDQQYLDIKFEDEKKAVNPSEGGFAILFADQLLTTELEPIANISVPVRYQHRHSAVQQDPTIAENLVQVIQHLQQAYNLNNQDKLLETDELLFTDHGATQAKSLVELTSVSDHFQIEDDQIVSISSILNDTSAMAPGFSLTLALANTAENQKQSILINNTGNQLGLSWLLTPAKKLLSESETELGDAS
ncbi:hypothetical protein RFH07_08540 [Acinetobacter seifertii]|uniref:hypothetical protein n=1 Tax=Acinetobacter seifertii TaxID=1530123 RepID=UPI00280CAB3A|nr:hypothetical protein [Acinetobacter seifertii]MDQ9036652.1 hypothetical protein [Acinetobacter seifertii]